jgi:hypothetical protein
MLLMDGGDEHQFFCWIIFGNIGKWLEFDENTIKVGKFIKN